MAFQDRVLHGVPLTRQNFTNPPLEMGIVPFWFWNGDLEYDEMDWQLRQYHDRGVRSLFIHGRMGLNVPYLSPEWFKRVKFAVERAKEIGIDTWVYDEMDWPSGTANKEVVREDPDLGQRYLELVALHIDGPLFTFLEAHDDRYVNTGDSNPIAAYGVTQEEFATTITSLVDLNKNLSWEKTLPWEAPAGKWVLLYFLEKRAPYYIDTLNPRSTERFLEVTHDRYKAAVGQEFGHTVPGFFTDEPAMYYYHVGMDNFVVPWSKQMFKIFRDRRGYDLKPYLPALYADVGPDTPRLRYDFWRTLTEQYAETYYKRIRDWCDEHGVIFTGHLLFEEFLRLAARCEGNMFKYLQHMHLIGVDHLYPKIGSEDEPDQHVALKLGSSAAHHFGSTRLLCESMGGTYWDCSLERMKWMNNWEYVLGVNLFNNHGYHYTIEGERKRDWPPSQFYHHTWWKYYDRFVQYNARLSHTLSGGRHVAKVLMLYPINSVWTNYTPQKRNAIGDVIEGDFQYLTDTLLRLHYDFDYVDEDVLANADVANGCIHIGEERFSTFILPPVTHIKRSTLEKLKAFVETGGRLIADTLLPIGLLDGEKEARLERLDDFFGFTPDDFLESFAGGATQFDIEQSGDNVFALRGPGLHKARPKKRLSELLQACDTPDVIIGSEVVFYLHRIKDDWNLFFLTNTSQEELGSVDISFEGLARPELWNPNDGTISPLLVYRHVDNRTEITLDFSASESHIVVLTQPSDETHVANANLDVTAFDGTTVLGFGNLNDRVFAEIGNGQLIQTLQQESRPARSPILLPDTYAFTPSHDNVLIVQSWKMTIEEGGLDAEACILPEYDDKAWLAVTNGAWEMQLPVEREEEVYPVVLWYRTTFDVVDMPSRASLMIDGFSGSAHTLWINGTEITAPGERSWLDAEIKTVDITDRIQPGMNSVVVRLTVTRRTDGILDLLKITGDFGVAGDVDQGYQIVNRPSHINSRDWTKQLFPCFSGTGEYAATVIVPDEYFDGGRILLEVECGQDVLEVCANDGVPHVAPWHPYRIDLTDHLRPGANEIRIGVTNTLLNILEGKPLASGLRKAPRLIHEHRYTLTKGATGGDKKQEE